MCEWKFVQFKWTFANIVVRTKTQLVGSHGQKGKAMHDTINCVCVGGQRWVTLSQHQVSAFNFNQNPKPPSKHNKNVTKIHIFLAAPCGLNFLENCTFIRLIESSNFELLDNYNNPISARCTLQSGSLDNKPKKKKLSSNWMIRDHHAQYSRSCNPSKFTSKPHTISVIHDFDCIGLLENSLITGNFK